MTNPTPAKDLQDDLLRAIEELKEADFKEFDLENADFEEDGVEVIDLEDADIEEAGVEVIMSPEQDN